jgi:hypothetical protein
MRNAMTQSKQATLDPSRFFGGLVPSSYDRGFLIGWLQLTLGSMVGWLWWIPVLHVLSADPGFIWMQIIGAPMIACVALVGAACVVHLACMALSCAGRGFDATFSAIAWAQGPQVLAILPLVGSPLALLWTLLISIRGLAALQGTSAAEATIAVRLPGAVMLLCCGSAVLFTLFPLALSLGDFHEPAW